MEGMCFICKGPLIDGATYNIAESRSTLLAVSRKRSDGNAEYLRKAESIEVHVNCKTKYIVKRASTGELQYKNSEFDIPPPPHASNFSPTKPKLRKTSESFDYTTHCFICGEKASAAEEAVKREKNRRKISEVKTPDVGARLNNILKNKRDKFSKGAFVRVCNVDLVGQKARYHRCCEKKITNINKASADAVGRPRDDHISDEMQKIYDYIEDSNDLQFSLLDFKDMLGPNAPDIRTMRARLIDHYGKQIKFLNKGTSPTLFCFRDGEYEVLKQSWKDSKKDVQEEKMKVLRSAAVIIRKDISKIANNRDYYRPSDSMLDNIDEFIPESLQFLIRNIIISNKKGNTATWITKCSSIEHAVISATRPKSFLSPLQLAIAVMLHRKYACKQMIDILFHLGLCSSYSEVIVYENSLLVSLPPQIIGRFFMQFVFDNADFNVNTLDGKNTFHSMGGIQVVTPAGCFPKKQPVLRLTQKPTTEQLEAVPKIPFLFYKNNNPKNYRDITVANPKIPDFDNSNICNADILWLYGKTKLNNVMGWNGFMGKLTKNEPYERSKIICLPFVNASPSDRNTIFSVVKYSADVAKTHNIHTCFVTFDQPLYQKAVEIVKSSNDSDGLSNVIVRLGGFHLLMSYLGTIGYIMDGSGLEQALSVCYAQNTVKKMLIGHAYARAVRGHTLLYLALCKNFFKELTLTGEEQREMESLLSSSKSFDDLDKEELLSSVNSKFLAKMDEIKKRGRTAQLWVQYVEMVAIAKSFMRAEKMGGLKSQLKFITQMLPFFHAAGHFNYAKSAHLYVQEMRNWITSMEEFHQDTGRNDPETMSKMNEFENFVLNGYCTVRRTGKFWSGNHTDMTIEQDFMRLIKVDGGIVGRGFDDKTTERFIQTIPYLLDICETVEKHCGVNFNTADQHVDARDSRIQRDNLDLAKVVEWFEEHDPFPVEPNLISLSSGITGRDDINCYESFRVGKDCVKNLIGEHFAEITLKRANRVKPLSIMNSSIKIGGEIVPVDPMLIFQRISVMKESNEDLREYFKYELSPYPTSLFNDGVMRKNVKSALFDLLEAASFPFEAHECTYVIDGGMLLHRVPWNQKDQYKDVLKSYVKWVTDNFKVTSNSDISVVFDGYASNSRSTKGQERLRRSSVKNFSPFINFFDNTPVSTTSEKFLTNHLNKERLIQFLKDYLLNVEMNVHVAPDDADLLIVKRALEEVKKKPCVIVAEDTDVLVLLTALVPENQTIYFLKHARGNTDETFFSSKSLDNYPFCKSNILFIHAFSGCDTTSCFFKKGKKSVIKNFEKKLASNEKLRTAMESFKLPNQTQDEVFTNGCIVLLALYNAPKNISDVDDYRYIAFMKAVVKKNAVKLEILPPTSDAARYHFYRVYFQVQQWLSNSLSPENWGWMPGNILAPIKMKQAPAPASVLKMIFCNCRTGCASNRMCTCRKSGLLCTRLCGSCMSESCTNFYNEITVDEDIEALEDDCENGTCSSDESE